MQIPDDGPPRRKGYGGPSIRFGPGRATERHYAHPAIDTRRPVHIAFAAPWQNVIREDRIDSVDTITWRFPDDVSGGDTVVVVVEAREPTIVGLYVAQSDIGDHELHRIQAFDGVAVSAVQQRTSGSFPTAPGTLEAETAAPILAAIEAEALDATPWWELPHPCSSDVAREGARIGESWGCNACGRDRADPGYSPRFQGHIEARGFDGEPAEPVGVCPSCHDILHQPLGPTFDELMFSHRPACPQCRERRTFTVLSGMPIGPPPYGTRSVGCVVFDPPSQFSCGACGHEW